MNILVSIAPLLSELNDPKPLTPLQMKFNAEGFAIFSEKGESGKLCAEGLDTPNDKDIQKTVAESLCKALGYEYEHISHYTLHFDHLINWQMIFCSFRSVKYSEVRNDTELNIRYVKVLDPRAAEISFVRTSCEKKQALYVSCGNLGSFRSRNSINFKCIHDSY